MVALCIGQTAYNIVAVSSDFPVENTKNKFEKLSRELKDVAIARIEHPEECLKDLAQYLDNSVGKSGINYRLKKIHEIAEDLRKGN